MLGVLEDKKAMVKVTDIRQLISRYLDSSAFRKLGRASKIDYHDCLMIIEEDLGAYNLKRIAVPSVSYTHLRAHET